MNSTSTLRGALATTTGRFKSGSYFSKKDTFRGLRNDLPSLLSKWSTKSPGIAFCCSVNSLLLHTRLPLTSPHSCNALASFLPFTGCWENLPQCFPFSPHQTHLHLCPFLFYPTVFQRERCLVFRRGTSLDRGLCILEEARNQRAGSHISSCL